MNTALINSTVIHSQKSSILAQTMLLIGSRILFLLFTLLFAEKVFAEDFRDQQDRMRNEYYQQQDTQREMNRMRDYDELRQTQMNQEIKYRAQDEEMKKSAKKIQQRAHPYEPEIITHDRGVINNKENKNLNKEPESDQKQSGEMPKVNMNKLLED